MGDWRTSRYGAEKRDAGERVGRRRSLATMYERYGWKVSFKDRAGGLEEGSDGREDEEGRADWKGEEEEEEYTAVVWEVFFSAATGPGGVFEEKEEEEEA